MKVPALPLMATSSIVYMAIRPAATPSLGHSEPEGSREYFLHLDWSGGIKTQIVCW